LNFSNKRKKFGGKAASLIWLNSAVKDARKWIEGNWVVPSFAVYEIKPPEGPYPQGTNHYSGGRFAVRSGSSISLPGLMDTLLNVPGNRVQKAVEKVYQSFDRPSVQKFLETIPNPPKGTGVVVQEMVKNHDAMIYGVIFTASAKGFPDPYMIYSDSPGDVVGTGEGKRVPAHPAFRWLANRWFEEFDSPPEIEVAHDTIRNIWYLLQIRDQKLTPAEKAALEGKMLRAPDVEPYASISGAGYAEIEEESEVVTIEEAEPGPTLEAARNGARLIIAESGNPHSHAAVIARTEGVAFGVGGVDVPTPFTFLDGHFYHPPVDIEMIEDKRNFELAASKIDWTPLDLLTKGGKIYLSLGDDFPNRFIQGLVRYKKYLFGKGELYYLPEFALLLSLAGYMTCLGEARHELRFGLMSVHSGGGRNVIYKEALAGYYVPPQEWLQVVHRIFKEGTFSGGGYGGKKWANIAEHTLELISILAQFRENPTSLTFSHLDRAVTAIEAIEHNASIYWTKFRSGQTGHRILTSFSKSSSWEDLENRIQDMILYADHTYVESFLRESLEGMEEPIQYPKLHDPVGKYVLEDLPTFDELVEKFEKERLEKLKKMKMEEKMKAKAKQGVKLYYEAYTEEELLATDDDKPDPNQQQELYHDGTPQSEPEPEPEPKVEPEPEAEPEPEPVKKEKRLKKEDNEETDN